MKKMLLIALMAITTLGFSFTTINAGDTAYVGGTSTPFNPGQTEWLDENVDFGFDLEVCMNGFESFGYNIYAGQHIFAGTVDVYINSNGDLVFHVDLVEGALAKEFHIYMYDEANQMPLSRPAPGQADLVVENLYMNEFMYVIPMGELVDYEDYFFIFHLALVDDEDAGTPPSGVAGETAYVGGPNGPSSGAWFYAMAFVLVPCTIVEPPVDPDLGEETAYAYFGNMSIPFDERGRPWGWYAEYQEGLFPVYAGAARNNINKGTLVGHILVDGLDVTFMPLSGFEAIGYHYYIGPNVPKRVPGQWQVITTDINEAVYMTFHLDVTGEFE